MKRVAAVAALFLAGCASTGGQKADYVSPACNGLGAYGLVLAAGPIGLLGLGLVSQTCEKLNQ